MKSIGSLLVIFGLAAVVWGFMDKAPRLLTWIYNWGEGAAWAIKIGFIVLGVVIYIMGSRQHKAESKAS